jgi:hypothetical protein
VAIAKWQCSNQLYRNAMGVFHHVGSAALNSYTNTKAVAFGDYNADGWPDLAFGNNNSPDQLLQNLGDGTFAPVSTIIASDTASLQTRAIAWGDFDGALL